MPYTIRESWFSMNIVPFRTVPKWPPTPVHIFIYSSVSQVELVLLIYRSIDFLAPSVTHKLENQILTSFSPTLGRAISALL